MIDRLFEWMQLNSAASALGLGRGERSIVGSGVHLEIVSSSNGKSKDCVYTVELPGFPPYLKLNREDLLQDAARSHHLTGDEDFDDVFGIQTQQVEATLRYLTENRRGLLLDTLFTYPEAHIENGAIKGIFTYAIGSSEKIKVRLQSMMYLQKHISEPPARAHKPAGWVNHSRRKTLSNYLVGAGAAALCASGYVMSGLNMGIELKGVTTMACVLVLGFLAGLHHIIAGVFARSEFLGRRKLIALSLASLYVPALGVLFKVFPPSAFVREGWVALAVGCGVYALYVMGVDEMVGRTTRHGHN